MIVAKSPKLMAKLASSFKKKNLVVGLVPTMGALHLGHISLIKKAKSECDKVVVSIFVNPVQFGPKEDFNKYPRVFAGDKKLLEDNDVDVVFYPTPGNMYPDGYLTYTYVDKMSKALCGKTRPIHFRGVTTVVLKLFNIVKPDIAYFGQKDAQQLLIVKKMVKDLDLDVIVRGLPTVREKDGLAMSSRNRYLTQNEHMDALAINRSLKLAKVLVKKNIRDAKSIINTLRRYILKEAKSAKIDYISIVNMDDLEEVKRLKGKALLAMAVYIGKTRLIDNTVLNA